MSAFCFAVCLLGPGEVPNVSSQSIAADKFRFERAAAIKRLIDTATAAAAVPARVNEAAVAFRTLGHMRATEAVPVLLDHLAFDPSGGRGGASGLPAFYANQPTLYALCQIGVPSLDPLMKRVGDGGKQVGTNSAAVVVRRVLGLELGTAYLKQKLAAEPNRERAVRIEQVLVGLVAVDPYYLQEPPDQPQRGYPDK